MTAAIAVDPSWTPVCALADLTPDRGVCALAGDRHVAVFRLSVTDELVAIDNHDPFCGASVLSRGLVGAEILDGDDCAYVASPLRKQRFDLRTGVCLDDRTVRVAVFEVMVDRGVVAVRPSAGASKPDDRRVGPEESLRGNGQETRS